MGDGPKPGDERIKRNPFYVQLRRTKEKCRSGQEAVFFEARHKGGKKGGLKQPIKGIKEEKEGERRGKTARSCSEKGRTEKRGKATKKRKATKGKKGKKQKVNNDMI